MPADHPPERLQVTAANMLVDAVSAEVAEAWQTAGLTGILLKGPSISRWLYETPSQRPYVDSDFLVSPAEQHACEDVLRGLGFAPDPVDELQREIAQARNWRRHSDGAMVDLHRTLGAVEAPPERVWSVLAASTEPMIVARLRLRVLAIEARALHVALHALQHGIDGDKAVSDLRLALQRLPRDVWVAAAELAEAIESRAAFAAGLRLLPEGQALADDMGLSERASLRVTLRRGSPGRLALGYALVFDELRRGGLGAGARSIARKVVPSREYMREWTPNATGKKVGLIHAYLYRLVWLVKHSIRGLRLLNATSSKREDSFYILPLNGESEPPVGGTLQSDTDSVP
ncbi:MAG: nucleotidyltransferase family protein [Actinomycetota bacterium]